MSNPERLHTLESFLAAGRNFKSEKLPQLPEFINVSKKKCQIVR